MKPKIQMRIGLWGAIAFTVLGVYQFIHQPSLSVYGRLGIITSLTLFVIYIFGIIRKKLKTAQGAYSVWWSVWVVLLGLMSICFLGLCIIDSHSRENFLMLLLILLCLGVFFGIITFILWMGLRGLKRTIEDESRLNEEKTSTAEKAGEK